MKKPKPMILAVAVLLCAGCAMGQSAKTWEPEKHKPLKVVHACVYIYDTEEGRGSTKDFEPCKPEDEKKLNGVPREAPKPDLSTKKRCESAGGIWGTWLALPADIMAGELAVKAGRSQAGCLIPAKDKP